MGAPREVLDLIKTKPDGLTVDEVSSRIGITPAGARTILWTLQDIGLLQYEKMVVRGVNRRRAKIPGRYKLV